MTTTSTTGEVDLRDYDLETRRNYDSVVRGYAVELCEFVPPNGVNIMRP